MTLSNYKKIMVGTLVCLIAGCSARIDQRGKLPEPEKLQQLKPGINSKEDVLRLIGSPTTISTFDDRIWLYVYRETETKSFLNPKVIEQKQIIVTFDAGGILKSVENHSNEKDIPPVKTVTPTSGYEPSWLQEIFGSYGRFAKKGRPD